MKKEQNERAKKLHKIAIPSTGRFRDSSPIEQTPSDLVNKGKDWTGVGEHVLKAMEGVTVEAAAKEHYPNNPEWQLIFELGANWQSNRLSEKEGELISQMTEIFKWLLGHYDFPEPPKEGRPRYYWRSHLQEKLKEIGVEIKGVGSPFQPRETDKP